MQLATQRLILRPWRDSDAADLYEYARDPRVGPIAGWPPHASVEESADIIRTVFNRPEVYALQSRENGRAIGCVGILIGADSNFSLGEREGEIAYWIGVPYWGRGLVPEAVREVMRHAFLDLQLDALWCGYFADNLQSMSAQANAVPPSPHRGQPVQPLPRRLPHRAHQPHHCQGMAGAADRTAAHVITAQPSLRSMNNNSSVEASSTGWKPNRGRAPTLRRCHDRHAGSGAAHPATAGPRQQQLHQHPAQAAPTRLRRDNDAAQVGSAGRGQPVLAEPHARTLPVQQHPTRALRQFKSLCECLRQQRNARPGQPSVASLQPNRASQRYAGNAEVEPVATVWAYGSLCGPVNLPRSLPGLEGDEQALAADVLARTGLR